MERLICAVFADERAAVDGVQRLVDDAIDPATVSALIHEGELHHEDLPTHATQARVRAIQGSLVGAGLGAVLGGLLAGPAGLVGAGALSAVLFGTAGGLYGALGGAITGNDDVKPELADLAAEIAGGKVLVTAVVRGAEPEQRVTELLTAAGGRVLSIA